MPQGDTITSMSELKDDNAYPDCAMCGACCARMSVLAVTEDEYHAMIDAAREVEPIDRGDAGCPLLADDGRCSIWQARPQVCRLYNCHVPRTRILEDHPEVHVPEKLHLICLHETFLPHLPGRPECL